MISSGTGFFISKAGHIITNEHVVRGCETVRVRGAVAPTLARVVKADKQRDLALLRAAAIPPRIAPIRAAGGNPIRPGEPLLVIGYPEEHGKTGRYFLTSSRVKDITGPTGDDRWLQFEDSTRQGNSGGPLLDRSGNVIGVITAKMTFQKINSLNGRIMHQEQSDVAINLPHLWEFLKGTQVHTVTLNSALQHGTGYLEQMASQYIVNIHCAH